MNSGLVPRIWPERQASEPTRATKTSPAQFIAQARAEIAKVVWPSRREVMLTTIMVFIMAALTATFFSLVDMAIRFGLKLIVGGL